MVDQCIGGVRALVCDALGANPRPCPHGCRADFFAHCGVVLQKEQRENPFSGIKLFQRFVARGFSQTVMLLLFDHLRCCNHGPYATDGQAQGKVMVFE